MNVLGRTDDASTSEATRPLLIRDVARRSLPPLLLAAILVVLDRSGGAVVAAAAAGLLAIVSVTMPRIAAALDEALSFLAKVAANLLSRVLATLMWAAAVLPAWLWGKATGESVLRSRLEDPRSSWAQTSSVHGRVASGAASAPFRTVAAERPRRRGLRAHLARAALVVAAVGALVTALPLGSEARIEPSGPYELKVHPQFLPGAPPEVASGRSATSHAGIPIGGYAYPDEAWVPRYFGELGEVPYRPDLILGTTLKDFTGTYLNISNGRRVSYSPHDPEITVWFFGGSTMFGIGQRDNHTIPSEVAKLAEADGIKIRAENLGVTAYVNWQETEVFEQQLTLGREKPSLAVFYDGLNDNSLPSERSNIGDTFPDVVRRKAYSSYERDLSRHIVGNADPVPWSPARTEAEIDTAAQQYRRGVQLARILGEAYGVEVMHFWQPEPFSKVPNKHDDELWKRIGYDTQLVPNAVQRYDEVRKRSGVDPIDLSRSLDNLDRPVYFDAGHTNEFGARTVAKAMYKKLRPKLLELTRSGN